MTTEGMAQQRILIAAGLAHADGQAAPRFIDLPDPKTGATSAYLLTPAGLREVVWYKQQLSSWFVGDYVLGDGGMYVGTPVDPLLILLPVLEKCRGEGTFCELEHILERVDAAAAPLLAPLLQGQAECLCDFKDAGGERYFRFNEAKALAWLRLKVEQGVAALRAAPGGGFAGMDDAALTAYAAGLMGEYLPDRWAAQLSTSLGVPHASAQRAAPAAMPAGVPASYQGSAAYDTSAIDHTPQEPKRPRLDPKEAAKAKAAESRQANKVAKLAKEASSMRKMSSFFTKAPSQTS